MYALHSKAYAAASGGRAKVSRRQAVKFFGRNRFGHYAPWPVRRGKSRPGVHIVGWGVLNDTIAER
jgi:hypothetical protein